MFANIGVGHVCHVWTEFIFGARSLADVHMQVYKHTTTHGDQELR